MRIRLGKASAHWCLAFSGAAHANCQDHKCHPHQALCSRAVTRTGSRRQRPLNVFCVEKLPYRRLPSAEPQRLLPEGRDRE